LTDEPSHLSVDALMNDLQARVRDRLRRQLIEAGAGEALADSQVFAEVEALLRRAAESADRKTLILPELLGDPRSWRLAMAMQYQSHRAAGSASAIIFLKRRVLMPLFRWLFEYSRDNFERQRRVNDVLFACVQELAIETARLRRELHRLAPPGPANRA
jgi:hypothetical protein